MGSLCRLKPTDLASRVFIRRLFHYQNKCTSTNKGFIPDIMTILQKYSLEAYIKQLISEGTFPSKYTWKRICKQTVLTYEQSNRTTRMNNSEDFFRFRVTHPRLCPGNIWRAALEQPNSFESLAFLAKLLCKTKTIAPSSCTICDTPYQDELFHKVFDCPGNELQLTRVRYMISGKHQLTIS